MLAGVGGRTIEEAMERVSMDEVEGWMQYIAKRGSLNVGLRLELMVAKLCSICALGFKINREDGTPFGIEDFAPHVFGTEPSEDEAPATVDEIGALLTSIAKTRS